MSSNAFYPITALLYAGLAAAALGRGGSGATRPRAASGEARGALRWGTLGALSLHAWLLYGALFAPEGTNLNLGIALSLIAWLTTLIYWVESLWYPIGILQTLILPVAALAVLLPYWMPAQHLLSYAGTPWFTVHLVISMLAYGMITIAALHALLAWVLEARLHSGSVPGFLRGLPPLISLERLAFRILAVGFGLLTLTVVSGVFFSEVLFGKPFQLTHKVVFGIIAWATFALLLAGRHWRGWRGRTAARWTLAGFGFLFLAYVGSKFVLEVILQRA